MRYLVLSRRWFVVVLAFALTQLFVGCNPMKDSEAAAKAIADFHTKLDAGQFKPIYDGAHAEFKSASTEKDFVALLEAIHRKLGNIRSSERAGWNINTYNLNTNMTMVYKTMFAGGEATETFVYRVDGERALLLGYHINSNALIVK